MAVVPTKTQAALRPPPKPAGYPPSGQSASTSTGPAGLSLVAPGDSIPSNSPDDYPGFILDDDDTIATVARAHREACESARRAMSSLGRDDMVHGNWRGSLPMRWVHLRVLRELAHHFGHADIVREQLMNE